MRFETAKDLLLNEGFRIVEDFEVAEIDVGPEMPVEDGVGALHRHRVPAGRPREG